MISHEHQAKWLNEIDRELFIAVRLQLMATERPFGRYIRETLRYP